MLNITYALLLSLTLALNIPDRRLLSAQAPDLASAQSTVSSSRALNVDTNDLVVHGGWVQEAPPDQKITAAYMTIENRSAADISLQSASAEVAQVIELHKIEITDGMMKMHKVQAIDITAGREVELKPGGYHLMVIGLNRELKKGDTVSLTLQFSRDIKKAITLPVKTRSEMFKED